MMLADPLSTLSVRFMTMVHGRHRNLNFTATDKYSMFCGNLSKM